MDLFLLHSFILTWTLAGVARRLAARVADRLLVLGVCAWANLVLTSLLLSPLHKLGEPAWFFSTSTLLALLAYLSAPFIPPETPADSASPGDAAAGPNPWLLGACWLTLAPLALASLAVAGAYEPNNADALAYQLPRALFYLGQGSLAHFAASDPRQVLLPFNCDLVHLFGFVYGPPAQCQNFFNLAAWVLSGVAVYRFCRCCAFAPNASLIATWLALAATPVIAQAATTTPDLPVGVALLCALIFALKWRQSRRAGDALLSGLAAGLAAGGSLGGLLLTVTAGLLALAWGYRTGEYLRPQTKRAWLLPVLLAVLVGLPFALINLVSGRPGLASLWSAAFPGPAAGAAREAWSGFLPLPRELPPLAVLNEDLVGFGLAGLLGLAGALWCALRFKNPARWFSLLVLGWILATLVVHRGPPPGPRDFVLAWLVLSPAFAAVLEAGQTGRRLRRFSIYAAFLVVILATGRAAGIYLMQNTSRPLPPLLNPALMRPALPPLPPPMVWQLSPEPHINIDADDRNEQLFPIMARLPYSRFTARPDAPRDAYRVFSGLTLARHAGFEELGRHRLYTQIYIATKRTAGVDFLATVGRGATARDYYGIKPYSESLPPIDSSRTLFVTVDPLPADRTPPANVRLRLTGLNPADRIRLAVSLRQDSGRVVPLTTFDASGEADVSITEPFDWLVFQALDAAGEKEISSTAIPYRTPAPVAPGPVAPEAKPATRSLFVADLMQAQDAGVAASNGLLPPAGPFPQWDLPYVRYARDATTTLTVPATPDLATLRVSFSLCLHARAKADLEILFNGKVVQRHRIDGRATWLDQTLELTPQPGPNVLAFRDVTPRNELDWQDYLNRYPDVKKHLVTHNIQLEKGAVEHYENNGRAEGRTMQTIAAPRRETLSYHFMFRKILIEGLKAP